MRIIHPRALPKKATIGIISPSSPQRDESRLDRGISYLESLGYHVKLGKHVLASHGGYLAGTDRERVQDLHAMFRDPSVDAIFCARGGYGCARILPLIDFNLIRKHPKIFVGFSDITSLQLALWKKSRLVTFSGAMPSVDMADEFDSASEEQFWRVITSRKPLGKLKQPWPMQVLQGGQAEGVLLGGNLSVLTSILGTDYMPSLRGSILALEDVGEATYRIDRMLTHVMLATKRTRPSGVLYGFWSQDARTQGSTPHRDVQEVLYERLDVSRGPVISGLMYGHERTKLTLPFGVRAAVSGTKGSLSLTEAAVE
jgi:muramoyltetrapeptide carboxypeptidase